MAETELANEKIVAQNSNKNEVVQRVQVIREKYLDNKKDLKEQPKPQ